MFLKEQCRELLAAKQDLIDKASMTLVGNRTFIQRIQASVGVPITSDSEDPAYINFNQLQMKNLTPLILFPLSSEGGSEPIDFPSISGYQIVLVNSLHL